MRYTELVRVEFIGALAGAIVLLGLLLGPALVGAAWHNTGMLALRDALLGRRVTANEIIGQGGLH